ncbi:MAG: alpha/beta fold hydrolase [Cellulosilyticaceae bacterium]
MAKNKKSKGKRCMMVLGSIIGIIAVLMVIGYFINKSALKKEDATLVPKGQMVEVDGGQINVYSEGNGEETIVILAGYGVSLPQAEYGPLMRALTDQYQVVICDYKGVGFSSGTDQPRTVANMTEETRAALKGAGIKAPYIFMPHSMGGLIAEDYAIKYPEEVTAMVLLDSTPTVAVNQKAPSIGWVYKLSEFLQSVGFTRFQVNIAPLPYKVENGYTEEEVSLLKTFTKRAFNDTMINMGIALPQFIEEMKSVSVPDGIPVLKIISKPTLEMTSKQLKEDGMAYQEKHLAKLGNEVKFELVDYPHLMHQTYAKEIAERAEKFLKEIDQ